MSLADRLSALTPDLLLRALHPGAGFAEFAALYLAVVLAVVLTGILTGLFFEIMNARHPERRVQSDRDNPHKWRELVYAPGSILSLSLCVAFGIFAQTQEWAPTPLPLNWWTGPLTLVVSIILYDTWFYWIHRLFHTRALYRFHARHHKSLAPTVWSVHHETLLDSILHQLYFALVVFVFPIPWPMLLLHKIYDQITGMAGHAGYEHFASPLGRTPWPLSSTVFHDQHHSHFRYNYAHTFSFWDRIMGTLHPQYDATLRKFEHRAALREGATKISAEKQRPLRSHD